MKYHEGTTKARLIFTENWIKKKEYKIKQIIVNKNIDFVCCINT